MEPMGSAKKKKKAEKSRKSEIIQIKLQIAKPGSKKYTHLDWNEMLRENGKQRDEDELRRFYDEDTLFMAKKLSETKSKSGKKIRVNLDEIQHMNRNCGYDMDDDFIDDTEAVDDSVFASKKGGFYAGRGELKAQNDVDDEDDEDDDDEEEEDSDDGGAQIQEKKQKNQQRKPLKEQQKKKKTSGESESSSSDSDAERPRLAGGPPTIRMAGGPPNGKRPAPPVVPGVRASDAAVPTMKTATSSSSSDIVCLDDDGEPPAKKKATAATVTLKKGRMDEDEHTATTSTSNGIPTVPKLSPQKTTTSSESPTSSTSTQKALTAEKASKLFDRLKSLGNRFKESKSTNFDDETMEIIRKYYDLINNSTGERVNVEPLIYTIATSFGITSEQVMKQITHAMLKKEPSTPSKTTVTATTVTPAPHEQIDWKLTPNELPSMSEMDLQMLTTIVKSWVAKKKLTTELMKKWIDEANRLKFSADQARLKFYELVQSAPDLDKTTQQQENGNEMPKHERSRKARMFLHQWVYLSRKYVEMILPTLKKDQPTDQLAQKQWLLRLADDAVYTFQFSEPRRHPPVSRRSSGLCPGKWQAGRRSDGNRHSPSCHRGENHQDSILHRNLSTSSEIIVFGRRGADEIEIKAGERGDCQASSGPESEISNKWPNGMEEPSLRGLNRELHDFTRSVLKRGVGRPSLGLKTPSSSPVKYTLSKTSGFPSLKKTTTSSGIVVKPSGAPTSSGAPSKPLGAIVTPSKPSGATTPSGNGSSGAAAVKSSGIFSKPPGVATTTCSGVTATSSKPTTSSESKNSEDVASKQRLQAMNQLVQVYLGKYVLATGNSTTAEICDSSKYPISEEMLTLLVIAVYSCGVPMASQMTMFKNILSNVGQTRMAAAIASQRIQQAQKMTEENYVKLFEYFSKLEKSAEEKKKAEQLARLEKIQEENRKKQEEKLRKEHEKQAEKEKIEARKREEKERKEREKREEKGEKSGKFEKFLREKEGKKRIGFRRNGYWHNRKRIDAGREKQRNKCKKRLKEEPKWKRRRPTLFKDSKRIFSWTTSIFCQSNRAKLMRKMAEAKRAEERENQIRMMRAQQAQRRREDTPPPPQMTTVPQNTPMDILNAAQEAAGLESYSTVKQEIPEKPEKPMSAFEKLASLRVRTQSADMKRGSEIQNPIQNPIQNSLFLPSNPPTPQFFPTVTQPLQHMDPPPAPNFGQNPNFQRQNSSQSHHIPAQTPQFLPQQPQVFQQRGPMFPENGNGQNMNMQQSKQGSTMNQSPQTLQHQQYPTNSYQSPIPNSMSNSSLMHTPLSNNSMVSQSPHQFSSHPSPMSQQYQTPPSVGMINHGMVQSPMPNQSPLQHFNYPTFSPQRVQQPPQMQQMHRQQNLSQQNLMMMQQQQQNSNQMMHQMNHHNNYPPQQQ
ncbi:Protein CBR-PQN-80 [Caenorhabditis briggsae]|uniref:Protein CBR-PQN-80 n=1 Tax=Caenorhabditis briggsae TaxID=6238 RepID=A8XX53_CAEBR|nr:Protein CBR-PQN-80 [Caenorhabditis briggsae]CAP37222.2 Protein CBR-PQN-80 [Caenorhabditis briggsae]